MVLAGTVDAVPILVPTHYVQLEETQEAIGACLGYVKLIVMHPRALEVVEVVVRQSGTPVELLHGSR